MHTVSDILNVLLEAIFVGFGIVVPIVALIRTSNLKAIAVKDLVILTAVQIVRIAGVFYFILWLLYIWQQYNEPAIAGMAPFKDRLFGSYWLVYLFSPLMKLLLSQLFWIKKLYNKKAALITFALLLIIIPSQRLLIFVTSLHRDYLPSSRSMSSGDFITGLALNIVVFIFILIPIILAGGKLKKVLKD